MMQIKNYQWAVVLIAIVSIALVSSANAQTLVHRYDFNSTNDTVGTANGTLLGTASLAGGALVTAGGNGAVSGQWGGTGPMMTLDSSAVSGLTGAFSIETWISCTTNWPKYDSLYAFSDGTQGNYLLANPVQGYGPWPSGVGICGAGGYGHNQDPNADWCQNVLGQWLDNNSLHQTVLTYDGTTFSWYTDGVLANYSGLSATAVDPGFNLSSLTDVAINGGSPFPDPALTGSTYDFRIYSGALSADQVAANFAAGADSVAVVPEPSTIVLLAAGIFSLLFRRLRKK
jgi:hypothetical protein